MQTHNLGYPRIGSRRELKKACESFWAGKISEEQLHIQAMTIRHTNWKIQQEAGVSLIPSNDFSFYDQVLDNSLMVGNVPERYKALIPSRDESMLSLYFAMARGDVEKNITALEMTKWFDTNYHYLVPEFIKGQTFKLLYNKPLEEYKMAEKLGFKTKPVLLGPVSYLLLGKEKTDGFHRLDLLESLLPVYMQILESLQQAGVNWIQIDEPCLVTDLSDIAKYAIRKTYAQICDRYPHLNIILTSYFGGLGENTALAASLPVAALHIDLVRSPEQLPAVLNEINNNMILSLGVVDGRNIWKNNFRNSLQVIDSAVKKLGSERVWLAPSCSLLHVPCDLEMENENTSLPSDVRHWMAYARQKLNEVSVLAKLAFSERDASRTVDKMLIENDLYVQSRISSTKVKDFTVQERLNKINLDNAERNIPFSKRKLIQQSNLQLPLFPTTTIGSFPQTTEVRALRAKLKQGELSPETYNHRIADEIYNTIKIQEELGLDVLVHGEFERNDMVEYFGERLKGFAFTLNGWVQSYGSRCVKPPIIYGDVSRPEPMTAKWTSYAQSLTQKSVKGMLTGPVTILQWSFVRDDQSRKTTAYQIALAIRDEVLDLGNAGIKVIQVDEPALREGLPLRKSEQANYLQWAVNAFRLSTCEVKPSTQIHTHMCYAEFNDIISSIIDMDADVITIETSRSQMELLEVFNRIKYPNDIGPGVYDIHSPRIPSVEEIMQLLSKAGQVIDSRQLWVNPDCGLKTRGWTETREALKNMITATQKLRVLQGLCQE